MFDDNADSVKKAGEIRPPGDDNSIDDPQLVFGSCFPSVYIYAFYSIKNGRRHDVKKRSEVHTMKLEANRNCVVLNVAGGREDGIPYAVHSVYADQERGGEGDGRQSTDQ